MRYNIIEYKNGMDETVFKVKRIGRFFDKTVGLKKYSLHYGHYTIRTFESFDAAKSVAENDFNTCEARAREKKRNKLTIVKIHEINLG